MFEFVAFEKDGFAAFRTDVLPSVCMMDAEFSTVGYDPSFIQIHDHRVFPSFVIFELIGVFFIETAGFIQGIMEFVAGDAGIAGAVQIKNELINEVQEFIFVRVPVDAVQPVDLVAPEQDIMGNKGFIAGACAKELLTGMQAQQIFLQMACQQFSGEFTRNTYLAFYKTFNEFIKDLFQY